MTKTNEAGAWRGQIRMPAPLAGWLKARADDRYRSINAEIVDIVLRAKEQAAFSAPTNAAGEAK